MAEAGVPAVISRFFWALYVQVWLNENTPSTALLNNSVNPHVLEYVPVTELLRALYTKTDWFFLKTKAWLQLSPDQAPRTLLAQFYLGFYPKTIMR